MLWLVVELTLDRDDCQRPRQQNHARVVARLVPTLRECLSSWRSRIFLGIGMSSTVEIRRGAIVDFHHEARTVFVL